MCIIILSWIKWTPVRLIKCFYHPISMKINHVIRPHSIRLYKLTLVKQGIHIDFNICIDSSRSNSKVREEEYLEWVLILSYTMASGTLYFIGSYMAFENPLKPKEISDAWMEQSRKLSTIKKIEDSRFLSTLCMTMKVTKEKREQKDSTYHIYLVYWSFSWWIWWEHADWWDSFTVQRKVILVL